MIGPRHLPGRQLRQLERALLPIPLRAYVKWLVTALRAEGLVCSHMDEPSAAADCRECQEVKGEIWARLQPHAFKVEGTECISMETAIEAYNTEVQLQSEAVHARDGSVTVIE